MRKMIEKKGITLIALVITIIVLLILAGITINLTIGQDGIINMAEKAGKNHIDAEVAEQTELAKLENQIESNIKSDRGTITDYKYLCTITELNKEISLPENFNELYLYGLDSCFVYIPKVMLDDTYERFRNGWYYNGNYEFLSVWATIDKIKIEYAHDKTTSVIDTYGVEVYYR